MAKLKGKIAVVSGGKSGMSLATAHLFVKEGASVIITGRIGNSVGPLGRAGRACKSRAFPWLTVIHRYENRFGLPVKEKLC